MNDHDPIPPDADRRRFLQLSGASAALGAAPWLASCVGSDRDEPDASAELRTYYLNLSNGQPGAEYYLFTGGRRHPITRAESHHVMAALAARPDLSAEHITHVVVNAPFSATSPQLCVIRAVHGPAPGDWHVLGMFHHRPQWAIDEARRRVAARAARGPRQQANPDPADTDPTDAYKDPLTTAATIVSHHPELLSLDATASAHIEMIIRSDVVVRQLATVIQRQGPAWARQVPQVDPITRQPINDSAGNPLYSTMYSAETMNFLGRAARSVLPKIKNDTSLGADITGADVTQANASLAGAAWVMRKGVTKVAAGQSAAAARPSRLWVPRTALAQVASGGTTFTQKDVTTGNGFTFTASGSGRSVTFTAHNWYLRYLGLYVRFLDGNNQPIPYSSLPADIKSQFNDRLSSGSDCFIQMLNQELVILGIPIESQSVSKTINLPDSAASVQLLAGGMGHGSKDFPNTILPGMVMTALLDLALPGLFLVMNAVQGFGVLMKSLSQNAPLVNASAQLIIQAVTDAGLSAGLDDNAIWTNLITSGLSFLKQAPQLYLVITQGIAAGEAVAATEDGLCFALGLIVQVMMAFATLAQIAETATQVGNAPWTYVSDVVATHDVTVTIDPDPTDTSGFPGTATNYRVVAVCDGGSPVDSGLIAMPGTTRTDSLTYKFNGLPAGGKVNFTATFTTSDGYLVGSGTTGSIDNLVETAEMTIKEFQIPLTPATVYSHKQKTQLVNGQRVWTATATPPATPALSCTNTNGSLCELAGITFSEPFAAIGYAWKASSRGVLTQQNGSGQLYQFANIASTATPQAGYAAPGIGWVNPARLVYDRANQSSNAFYIDSATGTNYVRRVTFAGVGNPPVIDGPTSNRTVGTFHFASDALVLVGSKLVSFNYANSTMEVLQLGATTADAQARTAVAVAGPGTRQGLLSGPVLAAAAHDGSILVVEQTLNRVQAFDSGGNPVLGAFQNGTSSWFPVQRTTVSTYWDIAVESTGYIYLLVQDSVSGFFCLDIYRQDGTFMATTTNIPAGRLAIDLFRNVYTLNFELLQSDPVVEPTVSQWIPSAP